MNVVRAKLVASPEDADAVIATCIVFVGIRGTRVVVDERSSTTVTCEIHEDDAAAHKLYQRLLSMHAARKLSRGSRVSWLKPAQQSCVPAMGGIATIECGFVVP